MEEELRNLILNKTKEIEELSTQLEIAKKAQEDNQEERYKLETIVTSLQKRVRRVTDDRQKLEGALSVISDKEPFSDEEKKKKIMELFEH